MMRLIDRFRVVMIGSLTLLSLFVPTCHGRIGALSEPVSNLFSSSIAQHPNGNFTKLSCNKYLDQDPCLTPWASKFGTETVFTKMVEIPCGKCIVMNPQAAILQMKAGMVILGKLIIPDGVRVQIETTGILVHGEFVIESSKPIDGDPDVVVTFLDSPIDMNFRLPPGEGSEDICGGRFGACGIGKKPLVVAGGIIDFRGLPAPSMPTWVPLYDVDDSMDGWPVPQSEYTQYHPPPEGCRSDGVLISHDFSEGPHPAISGSYGSFVELTERSMKITRRTHTQHCPVIDLKYVRNCLVPDRTLLLTARVMLHQGGRVERTDCAKGIGDNNCMSIYQARLSAKATGRTSSLWKEDRSFGSMLGQEISISLDFNLTQQHLDETNVYELLQIRGPGEGVDMELLEFSLRYPPQEAYPSDPSNVCLDLVPSNGDAELLGISPYPFHTSNQQAHLAVVREEGADNHYFEITGREFAVQKAGKGTAWRSAGITWNPSPSCVKRHTKYEFQADIRMQALRPVPAEWKLRGYPSNVRKPIVESIATCPESKGNWVKCTGFYEPSAEMSAATRYEVVLETDTSAFDVNYDIDNLSFKPTEGALDQLVLPKSVENLWSVGAEILINSHSSKWDGHSVRRIASVENHDKEGYVSVRLNEAISRPLSLSSHPYYATEVALLSRNIEFDGRSGGHLSVLHSPSLTQVIQGVGLLNMGEEGVRETFPIHFDNSRDSANSVVSRNTIRGSNQRCVVLDATHDVVVEGNVAFNNKGHCFVVESGMETGNVFRSNLGAYSRKAEKLMPQAGASGKDTDKTPAIFWSGSPSNQWIDNVASGSESYGYWFELRDAPRGFHADDYAGLHPKNARLIRFSGNSAHSTGAQSLAITGYSPTETATIDNFKSYMTDNDRFLMVKTSNVAAQNTLLDTPLESNSLPMNGTSVIGIESLDNNSPSEQRDEDTEDHGRAADPTDVFNLQAMS